MDALKQQVEPAAAVVSQQAGNGWRNLALLFGFCLAVLLGGSLAYWWQNAATAQTSAPQQVSQQPEPELADSSSIVAALVSAEPEAKPALAAEPATVKQPQVTQEALQPEPKIVSVTAPQQVAGSAGEQDSFAAGPEAEVSDELRQRFASAMAASEIDRRPLQPVLRGNSPPARDISELAPALQRKIPSMRFEAHVYATQSAQRWIKVNGKSLQEGQWVTADIRLKEITPQFVLLEMGNELFSLAALTDYEPDYR
tara:strand:+ start:3151 stop:3915 length:765 start_codon:yes stop_codon:yes gene_type:complete